MTFAETVQAKLEGLFSFVDDTGQTHYYEWIESLNSIYAPGVVNITSHVIVYKRWGQNYLADLSDPQFKKYFGKVQVWGYGVDKAV